MDRYTNGRLYVSPGTLTNRRLRELFGWKGLVWQGGKRLESRLCSGLDGGLSKTKTRHCAESTRQNVRPAAHGDEYGYEIEKYWRVSAVLPDGRLEVVTRRGKRLHIEATDPRLRPANWLERWFLIARFPPPPER